MDIEFNEILKLEFSEAWNQYRHIEELRQSQLGFAFTIILALTGFLVSIIDYFNVPDQNTKWILVGLYLLTSIAGIFLLLLFAGIVKSRYTRNFYVSTWKAIRDKIYPPNNTELIQSLDIFYSNNPYVKSPFFSIQRIASFIVYIFVIFILIGHYISLFYLSHILDTKTWIFSISIITIFSLVFIVYTFLILKFKTKKTVGAG
jgi:hypothetical protein